MKKCRQSREEVTDRQTDTVIATKKKSGKMMKMINENHNTRILNFILHGKINAGRPIKNILS